MEEDFEQGELKHEPRDYDHERERVRERRDSASRSPRSSPPVSKRKAEAELDEAPMESESKSIRRDGVLSWDYNEEEDAEMCKSGDISLTVLDKDVSKVIGRGGYALRQVRMLTGADVQMQKYAGSTEGGGDGHLRIAGTESQIRHCLALMRLKICPYEKDAYQKLLNICHDQCVPLGLLKFSVQETYMGRFMGKGGENIRRLQERYDVLINVVRMPKIEGKPEERDCSICGSPENVAECFVSLMSTLFPEPQPPKMSVHCRVAEEQVGRVIGRQGVCLHEFKQGSGCDLQLARERIEGQRFRDFLLIGTPEQIGRCLRLVQDKLANRPGKSPAAARDSRRPDEAPRERERDHREEREEREERRYDRSEDRSDRRSGRHDERDERDERRREDRSRGGYADDDDRRRDRHYEERYEERRSDYEAGGRRYDYDRGRDRSEKHAAAAAVVSDPWPETHSVATYPPVRSEYDTQEVDHHVTAPSSADLQQERDMMVLVPDELVGFIFGERGTFLNSVEKTTNTRVSVEKPDRNSRFREVHISGAVLDIIECNKMIQNKLKEHAVE